MAVGRLHAAVGLERSGRGVHERGSCPERVPDGRCGKVLTAPAPGPGLRRAPQKRYNLRLSVPPRRAPYRRRSTEQHLLVWGPLLFTPLRSGPKPFPEEKPECTLDSTFLWRELV